MTAQEALMIVLGFSAGVGIMAMPWMLIIFVVAPIALSLRGDDMRPLQRRKQNEAEKRRRKVKELEDALDEARRGANAAAAEEARRLLEQLNSQGG